MPSRGVTIHSGGGIAAGTSRGSVRSRSAQDAGSSLYEIAPVHDNARGCRQRDTASLK